MRRPSLAACRRYAPIALVVALAAGWALREVVAAADRADALTSRTVNVDQVALRESLDKGLRVGDVGIYLRGRTPGGSELVVGRYVIDAGKTPHEIHTHVQEEVLVLESGRADVVCDGLKSEAGRGSILYTRPNDPHGIYNTGSDPLIFTFIKWAPVADRSP